MCAVFGLIDYGKVFKANQRERIIHELSAECEIRGTDATGFAYNSGNDLRIFKRPVTASKLWLRLYDDANVILGHTRMTTQGDQKFNYNNHPFGGKAGKTKFALAHNGVIYNDAALRKELQLPEPTIETDSYIAVQIIEKYGKLNEENLAQMAEQIKGSFVFTILDEENNSYFVRGDNPLALYHFWDNGFYIYASTEAILERTLTSLGLAKYPHEKVGSKCGDILKIDRNGELLRFNFQPEITENYRYYPIWENQFYPNDFEIKRLEKLAERKGIPAEYIEILIDYGYTAADIEDLMCIPNAIDTVIAEVYCEYGFCDEV